MNRKVSMYGMYIALAFVFTYLESLIPINIGIPGIKLGLANVVVLTVLYVNGVRPAIWISLTRIVLAGFLYGNMTAIIFGAVGGIMSLLIMIVLKNSKIFSIKGVSVAGAVTHNLGQITVAMIMFQSQGIFYYLPILLVTGTVAGLIMGIISGTVVIRIKSYI